jgi:two-component system cell cycle response regulator DivK
MENASRRAAQKTLLVVEDNELNAKLYCDLLKAEGHRVLHTKYGTVAFEIARRVKPDLIIMDIQLPYASGLEVTKWLKKEKTLRAIPVIAVTSFAMKGDEEKILEGGCDAYMSIPISVIQFLETINRFLGTNRQGHLVPPR